MSKRVSRDRKQEIDIKDVYQSILRTTARQDQFESVIAELKKRVVRIESIQPSIEPTHGIHSSLLSLKSLSHEVVTNFEEMELRLSFIVKMQKILNELEKSLRRRGNYIFLKRIAIILHDIVRINPTEDMTKRQAEVLFEVCEYIEKNRNNLDLKKFGSLVRKRHASAINIYL